MVKKKLSEMKPANARMAIARDVLKLLDNKRFKPTKGSYFSFADCIWTPDEADLRNLLRKSSMPCRVCAIGAVIVAKALREDEISFRQAYQGKVDVLSELFTETQLRLMEVAFEGCDGRGYFEFDPASKTAAERFHDKYKLSRNRLRAIWTNVLKNRGEFIP